MILLPLPREDFASVWAKLEAAIESGYYARVKRHDEMERRLAEFAPLAKGAKDRAAFDAAVDAMIAGFHDSHFDFLTDEEPNYYMMDGLVAGEKAAEMPQVGAWFAKSPDGYTVQMVLEGGAAEAAGLRPGDVVLRVDGQPFSPVVSLRDRVGRTATLAYRRGDAPGEARVAVTWGRPLREFLDATVRSERVVERDGRRYGVVHLWTQANDDFAKVLADAIKGPFRDVDGLVLDLRSGFGGRFAEIQALLDGKNALYRKPLAVVIDHGSRSAKELLSYRLQKDGRAVLVGETTAGNVLGTMPRRINTWSYLELPMVDWVEDGVRLEGRGVSPDVPVTSGEDPVTRALDVLAARANAESGGTAGAPPAPKAAKRFP